ncbi:hypothetical protein ACQPYK_05470 [Streptosporangium sp. CA-135522]|uniref:hypothetical protein n=1 Tax=Streptosporangium sp. CA-135522 TaxID=3240072 RepID=UPI003D8D4B44
MLRSKLSGLSLMLVTAIAAVALPGGQHSAVAASAAAPNTVRVDLSRSLGDFPFPPGRQLSAIPKSWRYGTATDAALDRIGLDQSRVWLKFTDAYDVTTRTPRYDRSYDYLTAHASRSRALLVNWQSNYDPLVTGGAFTEAELFTAQRDMMADYKRRFPSIEWLESENETPSIADYYPMYRFTYRVVNAVNAMGLPGPKIKIGGPTTDIFTVRRIGQFLDLYAADQDPHKRLDFISYHQYLIDTSGDPTKWTALKENPAIVSTERAQLNAMLSQRGLATLPALVSETGVFPKDRESSLGLSADLHIQAAALASLHYYYLNQSGVTPFHWTIDHPENDRKDLFEDTATGVARPYYNTVLMQSMLPRTRYAATSDALSPQGIGVYGLAAAEPGKVSVMTWNYQWTHQAAYQSKTVLTNFPSAFRTSNVLVTRYKIGSESDTGTLDPVEQFVIGPRADGGYTSQTLELQPNELRLLVLTPTTKPVGWRPS